MKIADRMLPLFSRKLHLDYLTTMRVACTGFVSEQTGSTAAANALLLVKLLDRGVAIDFFSKPSFVDPRPAVGDRPGFRFVPVINHISDTARRKMQGVPLLGPIGVRSDAGCYNRLLVKRISLEHQRHAYNLCLWMGDYAHGSTTGLPTVSFVQGPPGTDARSILKQRDEILRLVGLYQTLKWTILARLRLSPLGLPPFHHSDHFIVGSLQSRDILCRTNGVNYRHVSVLPYPINFNLFRPDENARADECQNLRILWLGRIIPRKRLDLFLDGATLAIERGIDLHLTVVGPVGFVNGYDRLIESFRFPERLQWFRSIPRPEIPALMRRHDLLAQPSDEENFGSSVAEAQACGLPVIVGMTNGNADYLSARDIHLADDQAETFADALVEMWRRKRANQLGETMESRRIAKEHFHIDRVVDRLMAILGSVAVRA
jgi:glycosyltransferase involved in cell wall biosynthesis